MEPLSRWSVQEAQIEALRAKLEEQGNRLEEISRIARELREQVDRLSAKASPNEVRGASAR